jgi:hypothetical protein
LIISDDMSPKMTDDPIEILVAFANTELDDLDHEDLKRLCSQLGEFGRPYDRPPGVIDLDSTGGLLPIARENPLHPKRLQRINDDGMRELRKQIRRLQLRLRDILQRVAWGERAASLSLGLLNAKSKRERERTRTLIDKTPAPRASSVEVRFSGAFDLVPDRRGGYALLALRGSFEETFLLTVLFLVTKTKKLPLGSCLECHKLFRRSKRRRFCSNTCTNAMAQRFRRAGLAKPRSSSRRSNLKRKK